MNRLWVFFDSLNTFSGLFKCALSLKEVVFNVNSFDGLGVTPERDQRTTGMQPLVFKNSLKLTE